MNDAPDIERVVDALPVLAQSHSVEIQRAPAVVPARQAAALTATGFVAGVATAAVVSRRRRLSLRRGRRRSGPFGEILASNSFLIDVHLLKRH